MKKTLFLLSLIGGFAAANAATYNISDLDNRMYLGFYAADTVSTKSVLINLGTSSDVFNGLTLDFSSASSALSSTYGANWFNNAEVYWGLIGYDGAYGSDGSVYAAREAGQPLLESGFINGTSLSYDNYYSIVDNVQALIPAHTAGGATLSTIVGSTGNTHGISVVDNSSVSFNGLAEQNYGTFTSAVYGQVLNGLNIQRFTFDGSSLFATTGEGIYGVISQQNGVVTVVPEPTTYALFGFGALLLVLAYRRKVS
jgi:hypothetical protein